MPEVNIRNYALKRLIWIFVSRYPRLNIKEGKAVLTLSFDCDFKKDVKALPDLVSILSQYSIKASFACVGKWIEEYPQEHSLLVRGGHEIINHSYSHPDNQESNPNQRFNLLSREEQKEEIFKCHKVSVGVLGYKPIGFRTPHFARLYTAGIYDILSELGYSYSSSTSAYQSPTRGLPYISKNKIWEIPLSTCPVHQRTIFDSWHCFTHPEALHKDEDDFIYIFKRLIDKAILDQAYINIYLDPFDITPRKSLRVILDYIFKRREALLVLTYRQMLKQWLEINA